MKVFVSFFVVLFLVGCLESEHSKKPLISDFIKSEIKRLSTEKPKVIKIAMLNGKTDTILTDSLDWAKELNVFLMNDLDSVQLTGFLIDSSEQTVHRLGGIPVHSKTKTYRANDMSEKIQELAITYFGQMSSTGEFIVVSKNVKIVVQKKHEMFSYYKKLVYNSEPGYYRISGSQDIKFIEGIDYDISVNIIDGVTYCKK
ncbi:MAG: hypothetical protein NT150_13215 [Bacteroidetes bacterium]|nr:hypothetical protein [Bacteroidota bacterium]